MEGMVPRASCCAVALPMNAVIALDRAGGTRAVARLYAKRVKTKPEWHATKRARRFPLVRPLGQGVITTLMQPSCLSRNVL